MNGPATTHNVIINQPGTQQQHVAGATIQNSNGQIFLNINNRIVPVQTLNLKQANANNSMNMNTNNNNCNTNTNVNTNNNNNINNNTSANTNINNAGSLVNSSNGNQQQMLQQQQQQQTGQRIQIISNC